MHKTVVFWLNNARWVSIPQSLMPALTAAAMAGTKAGFSILMSFLAVFGVCMAHLAFNLFDDYFDYKKTKPGLRDTLARAGIRARTGKCSYLVSGEASVKQLHTAAVVFGCLALLPGVYIVLERGLSVIWIVLAAGFLGIFYSAEPLRLSYRGLGELTIGVIFGPLLVMGVYYSASGEFSWSTAVVGIALGILVTNILYTHSVLDYEADRTVNKKTLAGYIQTARGRLIASILLTYAPCLIVTAGILLGLLPIWHLVLVVLTLPFAFSLSRSMTKFAANPDEKIERRLWHGPMQKWKAIQNAGLEWFMFRWFLARNLLTLFSLLFIIASLIPMR